MRLSFFLNEAWESLRRNWVMTLASILTIFISMGILGTVLVVDRNLDEGFASLKNRVLIEIFLKDIDEGGSQEAVDALEARIVAMPEVKSHTYISKEQALVEFKKKLGDDADQILANLATNPLPASFRVYVKDANDVDEVAERFFDEPIVDNSPGKQDGVRYAQATVRRMLGTISFVEKAMWAVTIVFSIAAVLLISTTVRLSIFARRREIEIMQLVGATRWFIRWPFILEGFFTGLVGSLLAAFTVWGLNFLVNDWIEKSLDFLDPAAFDAILSSGTWPLGVIPTLALLGSVLGAIGSALALRRYLNV